MTPQHQAFLADLSRHLPAERLLTDPLRTLAYGTDASFYRLIPQIVVLARSEAEVATLLSLAHQHRVPLTLRAAGTSLSGQAVSDSVLVLVNEGWTGQEVLDDGLRIRLQPGVIGQHANDTLRPYGRKIGPDPASIATARIGGMAANNSSGMCCGTAQNTYHTLSDLRVMLADGTVLDTSDAANVAAFRTSHASLLDGLQALAERLRANPPLLAKVRHKYRLKNTTGYGLNALVDFDDPLDMLVHLMIGSEGTLGFIAGITYDTVPDHPHKASALVLFDSLDTCCRAVSALKEQRHATAVELVDRRSILAVQDKPGMPAFMYGELPTDAAALLIEVQSASPGELQAGTSRVDALVQSIRTGEYIAGVRALKFLAQDVTMKAGPAEVSGLDEVGARVTGIWPNTPVFMHGAWTTPEVSGDTVKVGATFSGFGAAPASVDFAFTFNGEGLVSRIGQVTTPQAPAQQWE